MVIPGYLAFHPNPKKPERALPAGACDAHCHVFGPAARFPVASSSTYVPVEAPKETWFGRYRHLGVTRAVVVQVSCHGTDNTAMLDALRAGATTTAALRSSRGTSRNEPSRSGRQAVPARRRAGCRLHGGRYRRHVRRPAGDLCQGPGRQGTRLRGLSLRSRVRTAANTGYRSPFGLLRIPANLACKTMGIASVVSTNRPVRSLRSDGFMPSASATATTWK